MKPFVLIVAIMVGVFAAAAGLSPVAAQSSVTTFGATRAQACFREAANGVSSSVSDCDEALAREALNGRDRRATLVNRAVINNRAGRLDAALADLNKALLEDPSLAEAYLNRGNTYFLMGRLDAALADYEAALANAITRDHVAWYNIGLVHDARQQRDLATAAYCRSIGSNENFEPSRAKLAERSGVCPGAEPPAD